MKVDSAGFEVGGESEVVEVAGDAFGQRQQTVDGLHDAIGQFCFYVGQDAVGIAFEGSRQITESSQTRALRPS